LELRKVCYLICEQEPDLRSQSQVLLEAFNHTAFDAQNTHVKHCP